MDNDVYIGQNDSAISVFRQEKFLKDVLKKCKLGEEMSIISDLDELRMNILTVYKDTSKFAGPSFIRVAVPNDFSLFSLEDEKETGMEALAEEVNQIWMSEFRKLKIKSLLKRKHEDNHNISNISPFPFPRCPYSLSHLDKSFSRNIVLPIEGLNSSYLVQFVPCDLLSVHPHPDHFAVLVLGEILSRAEGPIYTEIRGLGYAYGASINLYLWLGQLSFEINRSSDPVKALNQFYKILTKLLSDDGFDQLWYLKVLFLVHLLTLKQRKHLLHMDGYHTELQQVVVYRQLSALLYGDSSH
jgi:Zn-dependent M16 (insulinase) family peptidase